MQMTSASFSSSSDISEERLELARKMGATKSLKIESKDPAEVAQQVRETLGAMPDCAVEASGAQFSVQMAIRVSWLVTGF